MKILILITSLGAGGTEASTAALVPELERHGIRCEIAVLEKTSIGYEEAMLQAGIPLHRLEGDRLWTRIRSFRKLVQRVKPDVIHTAIFDADVVGRLGAWRMGIPVLSSLVNTSYDPARLADARVPGWKLRLVQMVDGFTARHLTTRLHAVSDGVAMANAQALRIPMNKIVVVERGRDPQLLTPSSTDSGQRVRQELGAPPGCPLLLAVGRIEYQKGHVHLIAALAPILRNHPTALLVIAGRPGNATPEVTAEISLRGLGDAVRLVDHRTDIPDLLAAADVFVLPSLYEGTAGAAIEAMAAGTPIVASDLAGLRGVLASDENALLVEASDTSALEAAIGRILTEPATARKLAEHARADFLERFTLGRSADRMAGLYRDLASNGGV